eukprot:CAMPEP_0194307552 /NCGR_PEP_ID=MMETSP0171-20130528/4450_1 /TAXON_ID=218684 /ORGANISM="Corethron pennatum, Strain L29A3" /LENGTH=389 /DNA_ID=CAMNT_0039059683 /DNA_START=23 /DNA_END=1192 /DNA_ORIENTATION=-
MAATFDPAFLFDKPTFCDTYFHAFKIFFAHWQTFMGLGLLLILVAAVIWIIIGFAFFASFFMAISSTVLPGISSSDAPSNYVGRFLLDRVLGITGASHVLAPHASRLLNKITDTSNDTTNDGFYNYDDGFFGDDGGMGNTTSVNTTNITAVLLAILPFFFLAMVLSLAATATFTGSLIRATAEAYTGVSPEFRSSLRYGWNAKWRIICFEFLFFVGVFIAYLVIVVLPVVLTGSLIAFVLLAIAYVIIYVVMVSSMTGAVPSIVIENVSTTGAFKRSWDLCKSSTCEIFCKLVVFSFGFEVISSIIMTVVTSSDSTAGTIVGSIFSFLISGFHVVMTIALSVVIYMGMRIEKEELTQVSFNQEQSLPVPDNKVNDVEASNEPIAVKTGI